MKEAFEKIIERLEDSYDITWKHDYFGGKKDAFCEAIEIVNQVAEENKNKYVSIGAYKQVAWERDIAIEQLHELGYEFGQKIEEEYCDYNVHFAPSTAIYFTTKCGHRYNGYLNGSIPYCGFCGKKIKVVE